MTGESTPLEATLELVRTILGDMGIPDVSNDAVLIDPDASDAEVVLGSAREFGRFIGQFSIHTGCMPYPLDVVRTATVAQFCERYVAESYPRLPGEPLESVAARPAKQRTMFEPQPFPICFVLGCGRSGTTLFRSMLDVHESLWAPGELHLAQFDTMAERATGAGPFLRHALLPETSERFGEAPEAFADRFSGWERDGIPVPEVYRLMHDADPLRQIVDKTPSYSGSPEDLDWIAAHFPNATFIHLIRNPHDVVRSLVRMQLYKGPLDEFAAGTNPHHVAETIWVRNNTNIADLVDRVEAERAIVVRYEDLVDRPEATLAGVCDLLEVGRDPRMANPYADASRAVARGAGDPRVNLLTEVVSRVPSEAFYPLGDACRELAGRFGFQTAQ